MKLDYETPGRSADLNREADPLSYALVLGPLSVLFGLSPFSALWPFFCFVLVPAGAIFGLAAVVYSLFAWLLRRWMLMIPLVGFTGLCINGYWIGRTIKYFADGGS